MLYDEAYVAIGYEEPWSGAIRLLLLLSAMLLSVAFLVLMPRRANQATARLKTEVVKRPGAT